LKAKKLSIPIIAVLLSKSVLACGLTDLGSCLPEAIYNFFLNLLNAPLLPMIEFIKILLTADASIGIFKGIWAIMVYTLSFFYALLFIYAGINFIISGNDFIRRENAKKWLKNTVIMVILVQSSFYIYDLLLQMGAVLSSSVMSLVDPHFFMITADNIINIGLQFLLTTVYSVILFITMLLLVFRYIVICFGVVLFPIALFCYFIYPLRGHGKFILNILLINIFNGFLISLVFLICSKLITITLFGSFKILVMICAMSFVDFIIIWSFKVALKHSVVDKAGEKIGQAAKYIAMFAG